MDLWPVVLLVLVLGLLAVSMFVLVEQRRRRAFEDYLRRKREEAIDLHLKGWTRRPARRAED